jgi:hypothetical protein
MALCMTHVALNTCAIHRKLNAAAGVENEIRAPNRIRAGERENCPQARPASAGVEIPHGNGRRTGVFGSGDTTLSCSDESSSHEASDAQEQRMKR